MAGTCSGSCPWRGLQLTVLVLVGVYIARYKLFIRYENRAGWISGNAIDSYWGGTRFEFLLGHGYSDWDFSWLSSVSPWKWSDSISILPWNFPFRFFPTCDSSGYLSIDAILSSHWNCNIIHNKTISVALFHFKWWTFCPIQWEIAVHSENSMTSINIHTVHLCVSYDSRNKQGLFP
jgi:hypothetical protein